MWRPQLVSRSSLRYQSTVDLHPPGVAHSHGNAIRPQVLRCRRAPSASQHRCRRPPDRSTIQRLMAQSRLQNTERARRLIGRKIASDVRRGRFLIGQYTVRACRRVRTPVLRRAECASGGTISSHQTRGGDSGFNEREQTLQRARRGCRPQGSSRAKLTSVALYMSGRRHAGENLAELLEKRPP